MLKNISRKKWLLIALALVFVYIVPLGTYPLIEPDEGRYAEIPREMIESGNYITPMLNYVKYFEKPVLLYWANAASMKLLGETEFASRIFCSLTGLLGVLTSGLLAAYIYGNFAGIAAAFITGTSLLYFAISAINLTDMPLSFFVTLALAAFYIAQDKEQNRKYYLLFYIACALAVLTKGLIGVVLPGGIIFFYILLTRKWKLFYKPLYIPGIILFFIVTVPWFWAVCKANPDFLRFFFIQEHFLRYTTKMHNRYEPFWYFIPFVIAGVFPWTGLIAGFFNKKSVLRTPKNPQIRDANIFLLTWLFFVLAFFSFSDSKLIPYIVPCLPPLAILIAADLTSLRPERFRALTFQLTLTCGLFAVALIVYSIIGREVTFRQTLHVVIFAVPALLAMPAASKYFILNRNDLKRGVFALIICAVIALAGLQGIFNIVAETRTMKYVAAEVSKIKRPGDIVATHADVLQGLSFYARVRVLTVGPEGELEYGLKQPEAAGWHITQQEFTEMWHKHDKNYILVVHHNDEYGAALAREAGVKAIPCARYVVIYREQ